MATLQHGEQTMVFIGVDAFKNAYDAAADSGDVITLSSGLFNSILISKSISVYGAGFEDDEATGTKATIIDGYIGLKNEEIATEDGDGNITKNIRKPNKCRFEGIAFVVNYSPDKTFRIDSDMSDIIFSKCMFNNIIIYNDIKHLMVNQCVGNNISGYYTPVVKSLYVVNSHLYEIAGYSLDKTSAIKIDHCIISHNGTPSGIGFYSNNILYSSLHSGAMAENNIFVGLNSSVGMGVQDMGNNWTGVADADVWAEENADGSYAEDKTFELKYPEKYVGTDGTQIGLHGGLYPWNKIPGTPRIVESNIDTKTSAEGKLKVSIKVEAQTKE